MYNRHIIKFIIEEYHKIQNAPVNEKINTIIDKLHRMQSAISTDESIITTHQEEILKEVSNEEPIRNERNDNVDIVNFLGIKSMDELKLYINPSLGYSRHYLLLDTNSIKPALVQLPVKIASWNYAPGNTNKQKGFCYSNYPIKNIMAIKLYLPVIKVSDTPFLITLNTTKLFSIFIEEFAVQSIILSETRKCHFLLIYDGVYINDRLRFRVDEEEDLIYRFTSPISDFNKISLSFGNPINLMNIILFFDLFQIAFELLCDDNI
jgi:hypothetical protein